MNLITAKDISMINHHYPLFYYLGNTSNWEISIFNRNHFNSNYMKKYKRVFFY